MLITGRLTAWEPWKNCLIKAESIQKIHPSILRVAEFTRKRRKNLYRGKKRQSNQWAKENWFKCNHIKAWRKLDWKNLLQSDYFFSPSSIALVVAKVADLWPPRRRLSSCQTDPLLLFFSSPSSRRDVEGADGLARHHHQLAAPCPRWTLLPPRPPHRLVPLSRKPVGWKFGLLGFFLFKRVHPEFKKKKKKTYPTYSAALPGWLTTLGFFFFYLKKKNLISQQI